MKKKEKTNSIKRKLLIALSVLLAVILVVLVVGTVFMESVLNMIGRNDNDEMMSESEYEQFLQDQKEEKDPNFQGTVIDKNDVQLNTQEEPVEDSDNIVNIMLIGQDRLPGEGRQRSDVMILCTFNKITKQLTATSFMRDMYVEIPGYRATKMNAAYQLGGMSLLEQCMATNFGVHIDGMVEVDFNGFIGVIDLLDGLEIELTEAEAYYLNNDIGRSPEGLVVWNLQPGLNHLTGEQALAYARTRAIGNGDFDRTARQRKVIGVLVERCKQMNLTQLTELMSEALPMLTTNLSNKEILEYVIDMLPLLTNLQINTQQIPAEGTWEYAEIDELSVLLVDLEANREILKQIMAEE